MNHNNSHNNHFYTSESKGTEISYSLDKNITLENSEGYEKLYHEISSLKDKSCISLDFSNVKLYDSYLIILINKIEFVAKTKNIIFKPIGLNESMIRFIDVLSKKDIDRTKSPADSFFYAYISSVGSFSLVALEDIRLFIEFLGDFITKFYSLPFHIKRMRWSDLPYHFTRSGVNAVPIVVLIVFLIGLISGYQGAMQLRQFGADIYIADLIGVSITRELGPLMTAILIAGRSGAAFTAEIGTMKVSEEIDALKSMGFEPMHFLVLPRVLAIMLAMPFLVLLADLAGIAGGLIAAMSTLDITFTGYFNQLQKALTYGDVFSGMAKSVIFGFLVATVGCFRGLQVHGGAESVGRFTTAAVVSGVLLIILADAVFTFIFQAIGI